MEIAVGRLYQETCAASPVISTVDHFSVSEGEEVFESHAGLEDELGGVIDAAGDHEGEVELRPILAAEMKSYAGGPVEDQFFEEFASTFVDRLADTEFDAVILSLHGAMMTDGSDDPEGDLLSRVHSQVGDQPVVISLDHHANVTTRMIDHVDGLVAYNTSPHVDIYETGRRAFELATAILTEPISPVIRMQKIPLLGTGLTTEDPMKGLFETRAERQRHPDVLSVAACPVHEFIDVPDMGFAMIAVTDDSPELAQEIVQSLASDAWNERSAFLEFSDSYTDLEDGLDRMLENAPAFTVLADAGDNVLAGAPGDSSAILERVLQAKYTNLSGAIPIVDPGCVDALAGKIGEATTIRVGGKLTPGLSPVDVHGKVVDVVTEPYELRGTYNDGKSIDLGRRIVFKVTDRDLFLIVSSIPAITTHPSFFTQHGVDATALDFAVVKNIGHFRPNFESVATEFVVVDTPGVIRTDPRDHPREKARPIYPLDDIELEEFSSSR